MVQTITFVTNQYCCDRIILAARQLADQTESELVVVEIENARYAMDPKAIDHLFTLSKSNRATMRLLFADNTFETMCDAVADSEYIVTGMPDSSSSILYKLWKRFPDKKFFTVDSDGSLIEVAQRVGSRTA